MKKIARAVERTYGMYGEKVCCSKIGCAAWVDSYFSCQGKTAPAPFIARRAGVGPHEVDLFDMCTSIFKVSL